MAGPADSDPLIEALLDPACWDAGVTGVELVETHISWVLLTGEHAYKIKKPLRLPFLDFGTLDARRHFCDEELRLNSRLAPELYLDVVPIGGRRDAPRVGATPAIEYAVRMRRFPAAARLDRQLEAGRVGTAAMAAFGERLARFHLELPPSERGEAAGSPTQIGRVVDDNLAQLEDCIGPADRKLLPPLRGWLTRQCRALGPLMAERKSAGAVREGHGDLHLENLVQLDGRILAFDALEFDPGLRWMDVVCEVAFLYMDLLARGATTLGHVLLNSYLETSGDYGGLPLLRFYAVHHALVRAKVRAIRQAQGDTDARRDRRRDSAAGPDSYLRLARTLTAPRQPVLAITHGLAGSGKTTVAGGLAAQWPAIRIRSDVERKRLHGLAATARSDSEPGKGLYTAAATAETYAALEHAARAALEAGCNVIVDAAFLERPRRQAFDRLAAEAGAGFRVLDCVAPEAQLRRRITARARRGGDASEADQDVLEYQERHRDPLTAAEEKRVCRVDTAAGIDYAELVAALETPGAGQ